MKSTISTHLISQVLLRQFTDESGLLNVHSKHDGNVRPVTTEEVAFVEIDSAIISILEQRWNHEVETQAIKTLNILHNGDVLRYEKHVNMIKKILALHYVRSVALILLLSASKDHYAKQIVKDVTAVYPDEEELIQARVSIEWTRVANETLPIILEENIDKVEKFMANHDLEIGIVPEGSSFVMSDSPAITISGDGKMGVLSGVPITESASFAMPLTPYHIVALKTKTKSKNVRYVQLTAKQVENANAKQIQHSFFEYYSNRVP